MQQASVSLHIALARPVCQPRSRGEGGSEGHELEEHDLLEASCSETEAPQASAKYKLRGAPGIIDLTRYGLIRLHELGKLGPLLSKLGRAPVSYTTLCAGAAKHILGALSNLI